MEIVPIQPLAASPRFTPREVVRLKAAQQGIDFCFGQLRNVPWSAVKLAAVIPIGRPEPTLRLLFCLTDQDRPLVVQADDIAFDDFLETQADNLEDSLRHLMRRLAEQQPRLIIPEETGAFLDGQTPEAAHEADLPSLATSM